MSKIIEGRIKDSPEGFTLEGKPRLLPCINTIKSFLRSFLTTWARAEKPDIANSVANTMVFVSSHIFLATCILIGFQYIQGHMQQSGLLSKAEMPKPCLSPNDLTALLKHLWCNNNHNYHRKCADRQRVALNFATLVYCFTSAQTGELYKSLCRRQVDQGAKVSAKAYYKVQSHAKL
jgi:hypothetical protein